METAVFPGKYENLAQIDDFVSQAAVNAGLSDEIAYDVQIAVDEACTNIIEHAYGGEGKGEITCSVGMGVEGLTVILTDTGRPFHPEKIRDPNIKAPLSKRKARGLGLYFIRHYMDEVRFDILSDGRNQLTLVKHSKKAEGETDH